jgi:hypothetical protein
MTASNGVRNGLVPLKSVSLVVLIATLNPAATSALRSDWVCVVRAS